MDHIDLFSLREQLSRHRILLCFNGPISQSLIEEIGNALRNYLQVEQIQPSAAMDVFGVYIELTQNIRQYALARGYDEHAAAATVIVARDELGHYIVQAGNLVDAADGQALLARIEDLAGRDKSELKALYKEQLRRPRATQSGGGAGLGLIDVARKSAQPLCASLTPIDAERAFLSLRAVI
ncbi:biofilm regulation protein kinase SiaB [Geoalkalibacter sp.]|uniref:biofilm regulation protein kinase SiaB n=1 Tax=Geoalkalibacter sp. TaxID=3041440 RepID=UPI00272E05A1|nr:biofilm regulation protein kinase SiaB [Geoalkalibacter sp.]